MKPGALPILTYHAIDSSGALTSTEPSWFVETIDALLEAGFRSIDLGRWIAAGRPPVEKGFALAFDDGMRSILGVADRLSRLGVSATIFLVADRIGLDNNWPGQPSQIPTARLLGRADLQALAEIGFRFGSHGCSHQKFTDLNSSRLKSELVASRERIEQLIGSPCRLLAYPYGSANRSVRADASKVYDAAFGTRLAYAQAADHSFQIPRIDAFYLRSAGALNRMIAGKWQTRLAVRSLLRAVRTTVVANC